MGSERRKYFVGSICSQEKHCGHPVSVKRQEQGAAGSSTTSCDRDRVRDVQGGTGESTWGWEHGDIVTWAEVPVITTMSPRSQPSPLTHAAKLGDSIFLFPSMVSPKSIIPSSAP